MALMFSPFRLSQFHKHFTSKVELIITLFAIRDNMVPPTLNYKHFDPFCDLDYVSDGPREAEIKIAMSNSFGFGGSNVSMVVGDV